MADAESEGVARGFVQNPGAEPPLTDAGKLDVSAGVGSQGTLTVAKSLGFGKPVSGSIPLASGEIAEDVALYYVRSEQIPTAVILGVRVHPDEGVVSTGGFMVQVFPDTRPDFISEVEARIGRMNSVSQDIAEKGDHKLMVEALFEGEEIYWLGETEVNFGCRCSRPFAASLLVGALAGETPEEPQEVKCPFCSMSYVFQPDESRAMMREEGIGHDEA
jgi:molecular chaperone Hsp33